MRDGRRWAVATRAAVAALMAVASGCDASPAPPGWAGTVDTLASGALHVANPVEGLWGDAQPWTLVEDLRLGTLDADGPELFGSVVDVEVDEAGRLYVLDSQAHELRVFEADGTHAYSVGREGEGPGEINRAVAVRVGADGTTWIVDPGNQRYTLFGPDGDLVEDRRRFTSGNVSPWSGQILEDGRVVDAEFGFGAEGPRTTLLSHLNDGTVIDTVRLPEFEPWAFMLESATTSAAYGIAYAPRLLYRIDRVGHVWVGISDRYRIAKTRLVGGDTVLVIEKPHSPVPVSAAENELALEGYAGFESQGGRIDPTRIPREHPAFQDLWVDPLGFLWVQPTVERLADATVETTYDARPATFDIFDEEGRYLGQLSSGMELHVFRITGTHVYGRSTDELGVQYVVRLRIDGR